MIDATVRTEILVKDGADVTLDDTTGTRYQIASVSKQFTAAAVLLLAAAGRLRPADPLARWIPGWPGVTLHHLLTHTSGLGHWHDYPMIDLTVRMEPAELRETFRSVPPLRPPGAGWSYSSPGYVLLAEVVERVSGTPFRTFLDERVFGPLGLTRTFSGPPGTAPDVADGHDASGRPVPTWELDVLGRGTGDVWSTAADMMTWLDAVEHGRLLPEPYRSLMVTEHAVTGGRAAARGYGYGVFTGEAGGRRWWHHDGDNAGFKSFAGCVPAAGHRVVILSNSDAIGARAVELLRAEGLR